MCRLAKAFPDTQGDIGTEHDKGDVFEAKVARTKEGYSSDSAVSVQLGVVDDDRLDDDSAVDDVGFLGGHSPELKNNCCTLPLQDD
ncbi:MAG: hypothetical protein RIS36_628 [Pseudomonadota bacterium]|jgi:hypothetical protein